jgi:hypothetical protein
MHLKLFGIRTDEAKKAKKRPQKDFIPLYKTLGFISFLAFSGREVRKGLAITKNG